MNIFYLDKCPVKAAKYQYNKHVVKMILESAQMLCTAHYVLDNRTRDLSNIPYRVTHINHPSTIWVRTNNRNYMWLYQHMIALGDEYTKRYNKKHLTITKCEDVLSKFPALLKDALYGDPIDMPQCMPDEYKDECSIQAYWNYYIGDKSHIAHKSETIYKCRPNE
tara:strand:+ start:115 stop:609 length:495 start_codon:yes stop_codon:yes gene_type:complete